MGRLQRVGIISMVVLFVLTSVIFSGWAIWDASRKKDDPQQAAKAASCSSQTPVPAQTLPAPETYKPAGDVKQLVTADLVPGLGRPAQPGDCLTVKYYGTLAKTGEVFDQNYDKPLAFQFLLGQGLVIAGWDEGLIGIRAAGTRRLVIPAELAYGNQAAGSIPANSDLVFIVQVTSIK